MNDLAMDLVRLCLHNRDGSHATQANRRRGLSAAAADLYQLGFRVPKATSLKPKHVTALVDYWYGQGIATATVKNRVGWLRWWAEKVDKTSIIPRDNLELGIRNREGDQRNRAWALPANFSLPDPRMALSVRLMAEFGLRVEEALKFRPRQADTGKAIVLQGSWTKGGRPRTIPVRTFTQRALLDEARFLVGSGSMIPPEDTYIRHRRRLEHETLKRGYTNLHGLRHQYAQTRYRDLTGWDCPKRGGPASADFTEADKTLDRAARLAIAEELGHARVAITVVYLG
jgi:integrase